MCDVKKLSKLETHIVKFSVNIEENVY